MAYTSSAGSAQPSEAAPPPLSGAGLFALLWNALADVLGTAATATLLRRATRSALARSPDLAGLTIARDKLEYRYNVPFTWDDQEDERPLIALRALVGDLRPLLIEMTGQVVIRHLERVAALRERGIIVPQGEQT